MKKKGTNALFSKLTRFIILMSLLWTMVYGLWTDVYAAVPHLLNYQGRLTDSSAAPLNGSYSITFRIYDAETAGDLLWQETHSGVVIQKGLFSVLLGSVTNLDLAFDKQYFLEIKVGEEVMSPRQRIASAGYAMRAEKAEIAEKAELATNAKNADKANLATSAQKADLATALSDTSGLVPKGAIIMCRASCPTGYTRVAELDGKFLVGGASYNSSAGGSNTHSHTTPSHSHNLDSGIVSGLVQGEATGVYVGQGAGGYIRLRAYISPPYQSAAALKTTTTQGGSDNTSSVDSRPSFATVVLCEKQ